MFKHTSLKTLDHKLSNVFKEVCLNEKLMPKYKLWIIFEMNEFLYQNIVDVTSIYDEYKGNWNKSLCRKNSKKFFIKKYSMLDNLNIFYECFIVFK